MLLICKRYNVAKIIINKESSSNNLIEFLNVLIGKTNKNESCLLFFEN